MRQRRNSPIIHEIIGVSVLTKERTTTYSGKYHGQKYWRLIVECERSPEIKKVCVFSDKVGTAGEVSAETILEDVEKSNYADRRFLFYCYKRDYKWDLAGWKDLEKKW